VVRQGRHVGFSITCVLLVGVLIDVRSSVHPQPWEDSQKTWIDPQSFRNDWIIALHTWLVIPYSWSVPIWFNEILDVTHEKTCFFEAKGPDSFAFIFNHSYIVIHVHLFMSRSLRKNGLFCVFFVKLGSKLARRKELLAPFAKQRREIRRKQFKVGLFNGGVTVVRCFFGKLRPRLRLYSCRETKDTPKDRVVYFPFQMAMKMAYKWRWS